MESKFSHNIVYNSNDGDFSISIDRHGVTEFVIQNYLLIPKNIFIEKARDPKKLEALIEHCMSPCIPREESDDG